MKHTVAVVNDDPHLASHFAWCLRQRDYEAEEYLSGRTPSRAEGDSRSAASEV